MKVRGLDCPDLANRSEGLANETEGVIRADPGPVDKSEVLRGQAGPQKFFMQPIIHESRDRVAAVARLNVTVCRGKAARRTGRLASTAALICYCIDS